MHIRLTPHSEDLLKQQMATGEFRTEEEVIERALETLASQEEVAWIEGRGSILQLQGLGKETWQEVEPQQFVDDERSSWNG